MTRIPFLLNIKSVIPKSRCIAVILLASLSTIYKSQNGNAFGFRFMYQGIYLQYSHV